MGLLVVLSFTST